MKNCKFFENEAYDTGAELDSNTEINSCTFTSNFGSGDAMVHGSDQVSCTFLSASNYSLTKGGGTENNPYKIEGLDDWDAFYFSVKNGKNYENAYLVLENDITVFSSIGIWASSDSAKKPFKGIFDGAGHTITLYSISGGSNKGAFGCTQGATVRNLTVDGRIEGAYSVGGIFGNASGSTAENCVNNATIVGSGSYVGGIAGWSGNGSKFISCVNNGNISAADSFGGIAGLSGGVSRFLNCFNYGTVSRRSGGNTGAGIIGYEESAVTVINAISFGTVSGPGIVGDADSGSTHERCYYDRNRISGASVVGTACTSDELKALNVDADHIVHSYVCEYEWTGDYSKCTARMVCTKCKSTVFGHVAETQASTSSVEEKTQPTCTDKGVKAYTAVFGSPFATQVKNVDVPAKGHSWVSLGDGGHECEVCRAKGLHEEDSTGHCKFCGELMTHSVTVTIGAHITGVEYKVGSDSAKTATATFTLSNLKVGTTIALNVTCETGYGYFGATELTVGTKNETVNLTAERTADLTNVAYCGADGVAGKVTTVKRIYPHMNRTIGDGNWYAIEGNVTVGTLTVNGTANLILVDGTTLTVSGGIRVEGSNELNIYGQGEGTGKLIANGADGCAGIGGGRGRDGDTGGYPHGADGGSCSRVTIYGGVISATGNRGGAGIGGGRGGDGNYPSQVGGESISDPVGNGGNGGKGGFVTINGGIVTAVGTGTGIGGGLGGYGCDTTVVIDTETEVVYQGKDGKQGTEATVTLGARVEVVEGKIGNDSKSVVIECTADLTDVAYCGEGGVAGKVTTAKRIYPHIGNIGGGNWYAIEGNVTVETLTVNGTANLILVDGTTLTVDGGIRVEGDNKLNIFAQSAGTGALIANGADGCAGIGGGAGENGTQEVDTTAGGSGGAVTIYGGIVTAIGSSGGAGIGGGRGGNGYNARALSESEDFHCYGAVGGAGGFVTINGGVVTAIGNGAGIGGGCGGEGGIVNDGIARLREPSGNGGAGAAVTINGGSVTATGGNGSAGIGGGRGAYCEWSRAGQEEDGAETVYGSGTGGSGGTVKITDGVVRATGGIGAVGIGGGVGGDNSNGRGGDGGAGGCVTIEGGIVTAKGGSVGAGMKGGVGIGGGNGGLGESSSEEYDIVPSSLLKHYGGGGTGGAGCTVTINGGIVTATGGGQSAGFGGGRGGDGGEWADGVDGTNVTLTVSGGVTESQNGIFVYGEPTITENMEVSGEFNKMAYIKIAEKPGPTCEGGEIAEEDGVWVVTPEGNVAAVTIKNLPDGATVAMKLNGYTIPSAAFMGFGTGENANVFSLALNPEGVVNGVRVQPTIGEDVGEPFAVGEGEVTLTIKTIPGLKYSLIRGTELGKIDTTVVTTPATSAETTLKDSTPPTSNAFYRVGVGK